MSASRQMLILAALGCVLITGCGRAPVGASLAGLEGMASDDGFAALDTDSNGRLSRTESAMPGFAFDEADADRDGGLSFFEWNARRDNADTALRIQLQRETVRDTADGLRTGTAIPTNRGAALTDPLV